MAILFRTRIMARFSLVITSLTVLLPAICNADGPDPECEDGVIIGSLATPFVELINGYRKKLIEGTQNNGKNEEALPKALNVKEVEWDCELEEALQWDVDWDKCRHNKTAAYEPSPDVANAYSCVHYASLLEYDDPWDPYKDVIGWNDLLAPYLQVVDNIDKAAFNIEYGRVAVRNETFDDVHDYAEWMRADVTKVACALSSCAIGGLGSYATICCTDQKRMEKASDFTLYETLTTTSTAATTPATTTSSIASTTIASAGATTKITTSVANTPTVPTSTPCPTAPTTPCSTVPTTPCPTYPPARAKREVKAVNAEVFVKRGKLPKATPDKNTICSSNIGMTDSLRTLFLDMHNYRRAKLALGEVTSYNRKRMSPAKNMLKLSYACELEASALRYAALCPSTGSKARGENFLRLAKVGFPSFVDAVNMTVYDWWDVVNDNAVINNTAKLQARHLRSPIATFTQMAWATTRFLGCAIADCNSYYVSICRYSPEGNVIGEMVYEPGHTCSECSRGTTCEEELGLCV